MNSTDLVWIELSREALEHNLKIVREIVGSEVSIAPCIKANAYGHGMIEVARILVENGVTWLAVQEVHDAVKLRAAGVTVPIMVMGSVLPADYPEVIREQFRVFISDEHALRPLAEEARRQGTSLPVHLEVDTGMSRYGILPEALHSMLDAIARYPELQLEAVVTHFASAGGPVYNHQHSKQLQVFDTVRAELRQRGITVPIHAAKSSAAVLYASTRHQIIRPGIMLYGLAGSNEVALALNRHQIQLKPILTLKTRVGLLKEIPAGTPVSYDATYITKRATKIAVLPIGYADGMSRLLSNHGHVLIRGHAAPILGRVCMNVIMVDVTDIPEVDIDDEVVVIGQQGELTLHADQIAVLTQTIPYEVLTSLREGLPRYVVD